MTLLGGQNYSDDLQLYVLSAVFLAASTVWYAFFRLKPSVYVLSAPWVFYGLAFFIIAIPSLSSKLHGTHSIIADIATWLYAVASAAAFIFFGLNFGEEAVRGLIPSAVMFLTLLYRVPPQKCGFCGPVSCKVHSKSGLRHYGTGVAD